MANGNSPFIIPGGDLRYHIKGKPGVPPRGLSESTVKFYAVQILLGLAALHERNVCYRDLKPDNLLLDSHGHLRLSDFGIAEQLQDGQDKATQRAGTLQYMSPEELAGQPYGLEVDLWAYGVCLFELLHAHHPFPYAYESKGQPNYFTIPPIDASPDATDLLRRLLCFDINNRITSCDQVFSHRWLADIDWTTHASRSLDPPIKPRPDRGNYSNSAALDEALVVTPPQPIPEALEAIFEGFQYISPSAISPPPNVDLRKYNLCGLGADSNGDQIGQVNEGDVTKPSTVGLPPGGDAPTKEGSNNGFVSGGVEGDRRTSDIINRSRHGNSLPNVPLDPHTIELQECIKSTYEPPTDRGMHTILPASNIRSPSLHVSGSMTSSRNNNNNNSNTSNNNNSNNSNNSVFMLSPPLRTKYRTSRATISGTGDTLAVSQLATTKDGQCEPPQYQSEKANDSKTIDQGSHQGNDLDTEHERDIRRARQESSAGPSTEQKEAVWTASPCGIADSLAMMEKARDSVSTRTLKGALAVARLSASAASLRRSLSAGSGIISAAAITFASIMIESSIACAVGGGYYGDHHIQTPSPHRGGNNIPHDHNHHPPRYPPKGSDQPVYLLPTEGSDSPGLPITSPNNNIIVTSSTLAPTTTIPPLRSTDATPCSVPNPSSTQFLTPPAPQRLQENATSPSSSSSTLSPVGDQTALLTGIASPTSASSSPGQTTLEREELKMGPWTTDLPQDVTIRIKDGIDPVLTSTSFSKSSGLTVTVTLASSSSDQNNDQNNTASATSSGN